MQTLYILVRWCHVVLLMGIAGVTLQFAGIVHPALRADLLHTLFPPKRRKWLAVWLAVSGITVYLLQAGLMGDGWSDVLSADMLLALPHTAFGQWWLIHLALTLLLSLLMRCALCSSSCWLWLVSGALITYGLTGHTSVHEGWLAWLYSGVHIVHLMAASFWLGGLLVVVQLLPLLRKADTALSARQSLITFSRAGHGAVLVLLLAGTMNILSVTGWPVHVFWSAYWQLMGLKLLCMIVLIILALVNRYYWVPRFAAESARRAFYLMTLTEVLLLLCAAGLSSTLATNSPMPMSS